MDCFVAVNKPVSWSSFDIVKLVRKTTGMKKVGHTGTLDKEASGLLIICMGKATGLVEDFMSMEKEYIVDGKLGEKTNTDDSSGDIIERKEIGTIPLDRFKNVLDSFLGKINQVPPMYSAIKIRGERLYKIARRGRTTKRKARRVLVKKLDVLSFSPPYFQLNVVCGKGFYVRALIRDIGEKLNVGAHVTSLERKRIGEYRLSEALTVDELRDRMKIFSNCVPVR